MVKKNKLAKSPSQTTAGVSQTDLENRIKELVAARAASRSLEATSSLTLDTVSKMSERAKRAFLEELALQIQFDWNGMLNEHRAVMSVGEAERYSRSPMEFGVYEGRPRKEVPSDYWAWMEEKSLEMLRWLRAKSSS